MVPVILLTGLERLSSTRDTAIWRSPPTQMNTASSLSYPEWHVPQGDHHSSRSQSLSEGTAPRTSTTAEQDFRCITESRFHDPHKLTESRGAVQPSRGVKIRDALESCWSSVTHLTPPLRSGAVGIPPFEYSAGYPRYRSSGLQYPPHSVDTR